MLVCLRVWLVIRIVHVVRQSIALGLILVSGRETFMRSDFSMVWTCVVVVATLNATSRSELKTK